MDRNLKRLRMLGGTAASQTWGRSDSEPLNKPVFFICLWIRFLCSKNHDWGWKSGLKWDLHNLTRVKLAVWSKLYRFKEDKSILHPSIIEEDVFPISRPRPGTASFSHALDVSVCPCLSPRSAASRFCLWIMKSSTSAEETVWSWDPRSGSACPTAPGRTCRCTADAVSPVSASTVANLSFQRFWWSVLINLDGNQGFPQGFEEGHPPQHCFRQQRYITLNLAYVKSNLSCQIFVTFKPPEASQHNR